MKKTFFLTCIILLFTFTIPFTRSVNAMPFYNLTPKDLVIRSQFTTNYASSSLERKNNIKLASSLINGTFLDVNEEFSFNRIVGERTEKRGFKIAKIIKDGKFIEGVGGGVCQVSTTLYNAVLLADLRISEYHQHSLAVSYIEPSFDAMVNSGSADLRFINNTKNPMIIYSAANDKEIKFTIYGEPLNKTVIRESKIIEILPVKNEYIDDSKKEFDDLYIGESRILKNGKAGFISVGYIIYQNNNKTQSKKIIRKNIYKSTNNIIVKGTKERQIENE